MKRKDGNFNCLSQSECDTKGSYCFKGSEFGLCCSEAERGRRISNNCFFFCLLISVCGKLEKVLTKLQIYIPNRLVLIGKNLFLPDKFRYKDV